MAWRYMQALRVYDVCQDDQVRTNTGNIATDKPVLSHRLQLKTKVPLLMNLCRKHESDGVGECCTLCQVGSGPHHTEGLQCATPKCQPFKRFFRVEQFY